MTKIALLILACALPASVHADTYKWVDDKGVTHYTDQPPPAGAKNVEQKKLKDSVIGTTLPYGLQQTIKNFPVTVYINDCGPPCNDARALLNRRGIPFTEKNPQDKAVNAELAALTKSGGGVPVLRVGSSIIRGYEASQWNSALDDAGYPQTAALQRPPAKPQAAADKAADPKKPAAGSEAGAEPAAAAPTDVTPPAGSSAPAPTQQ